MPAAASGAALDHRSLGDATQVPAVMAAPLPAECDDECLAARLAVLAACGGTAVLILSPIPGDEVVLWGACLTAFEWWAEACVEATEDQEQLASLVDESVAPPFSTAESPHG